MCVHFCLSSCKLLQCAYIFVYLRASYYNVRTFLFIFVQVTTMCVHFCLSSCELLQCAYIFVYLRASYYNVRKFFVYLCVCYYNVCTFFVSWCVLLQCVYIIFFINMGHPVGMCRSFIAVCLSMYLGGLILLQMV